jgi:hypothetical protein
MRRSGRLVSREWLLHISKELESIIEDHHSIAARVPEVFVERSGIRCIANFQSFGRSGPQRTSSA